MSNPRRRTVGTTDEQWKKPVPVQVELRLSPELYRLMVNWMMWRSPQGRSIVVGMQYDALAGVLRGTEHLSEEERPKPLPVIAAEAEQINRYVEELPAQLRRVLKVWWLEEGSIATKAKMCGCRKETMLVQLAFVHGLMERHFS